MEIKSLPVQNEDGDLVPGASASVYHMGSGELATIYDKDGAIISNPVVAGADGIIEFAAENGPYKVILTIGVQQYERFLYFSDIKEHNESPSAHPELSAFITSEADRAEVAADAATLNAGIYPDTAAGLSATIEGDYFSVPSPESEEYLTLYLHEAGPVATEIKRLLSEQGVISKTASIGLIEPHVRGTLAGTAGFPTSRTLYYATPVSRKGRIKRLRIRAAIDGTVNFRIQRPFAPAEQGVQSSLRINTPFVCVEGDNTFDVDIPVGAGEIIGATGSGILSYENLGSGNGDVLYDLSGNDITLPATRDDYVFGLVAEIEHIPTQGSAVGSYTAAAMRDAESEYVYGLPGTPVSGVTLGDRTFVLVPQFDEDTLVSAVDLYALSSGQLRISAWDDIRGVKHFRGDDRLLSFGAGLQSLAVDPPLQITKGQRLGFWTDGSLGYISGTPIVDGGYYHNGDGNGDTDEIESSSLVDSATVEMQIAFRVCPGSGVAQAAMGVARQALRMAGVGGGTAYEDTRSYIMFWIVGQSNGAGRGTTQSAFAIPTARGYKYDPTEDGLLHLVEPTGTDSKAQNDETTSFGTAIAAEVLRQSNGRVGAIIVNSCVGGSNINTWVTEGVNWLAAIPQWEAAVTDAVAKDLAVIGSIGVFSQGEANAGETIDIPVYKGRMVELLGNMQAVVGCGDQFKMLVVQTGYKEDAAPSQQVGYPLVRMAQTEVVRENDDFLMGFSGAKYFVDRGLIVDDGLGVHYETKGLDEIGGALGAMALPLAVGAVPVGFDPEP